MGATPETLKSVIIQSTRGRARLRLLEITRGKPRSKTPALEASNIGIPLPPFFRCGSPLHIGSQPPGLGKR